MINTNKTPSHPLSLLFTSIFALLYSCTITLLPPKPHPYYVWQTNMGSKSPKPRKLLRCKQILYMVQTMNHTNHTQIPYRYFENANIKMKSLLYKSGGGGGGGVRGAWYVRLTRVSFDMVGGMFFFTNSVMATSMFCHGQGYVLSCLGVCSVMARGMFCHGSGYVLSWLGVCSVMARGMFRHGQGYVLSWLGVCSVMARGMFCHGQGYVLSWLGVYFSHNFSMFQWLWLIR